MKTEIERKFLVRDDGWREGASASKSIRQGYLCADEARSVRVRISGDNALLTIKATLHERYTRLEYEYAIPVEDAHALLDSACVGAVLEKTRYVVRHGGLTWEVDEFGGDNAGLIVAEVELENADQAIVRPDWLGDEVTDDPRYLNVNLAKRPYGAW